VGPDICGWRKPISIDHLASQVIQRPDWVCEILSAKTKKQDQPKGDNFLEYAESGIPHYWTVDPLTGQITVFELVVDEYSLIQKASVNEVRNSVLSPFVTEFDATQLFAYMLRK
jgi:Uma2 family endonuclease